jgi:hypothetical protein
LSDCRCNAAARKNLSDGFFFAPLGRGAAVFFIGRKINGDAEAVVLYPKKRSLRFIAGATEPQNLPRQSINSDPVADLQGDLYSWRCLLYTLILKGVKFGKLWLAGKIQMTRA